MNTTAIEIFSSKENTDRLVEKCASSLNLDPTSEFLSIVKGISLSVFDVEGNKNCLNDLNGIVIREVSRYILDKRRDLLFKVISPVKHYLDISISSEDWTVLDPVMKTISILLESIDIDYASNNTVTRTNNTISFRERLASDKDLWSEELTVSLEPGNYTAEECLEELGDLMTEASKIANIYNVFYDIITDRVSIFTTTLDKLEDITRKKTRTCSKAGDFLIIPESSTILDMLGFSKNIFEDYRSIFTAKYRFRYEKPSFFQVKLLESSGKILADFKVPADADSSYPLSIKYEVPEESDCMQSMIVKVLPEDTEATLKGKIEYIQ